MFMCVWLFEACLELKHKTRCRNESGTLVSWTWRKIYSALSINLFLSDLWGTRAMFLSTVVCNPGVLTCIAAPLLTAWQRKTPLHNYL
jgi:hypothetical protein